MNTNRETERKHELHIEHCSGAGSATRRLFLNRKSARTVGIVKTGLRSASNPTSFHRRQLLAIAAELKAHD
jgi:hypothetical protein